MLLLSKIISSVTGGQNYMKVCMIVSYGILPNGCWDFWFVKKSITDITKTREKGSESSFWHIFPQPFSFKKNSTWVKVFCMKRSFFSLNPLWNHRLFWMFFFLLCFVYLLSNCASSESNIWTEFYESWNDLP